MSKRAQLLALIEQDIDDDLSDYRTLERHMQALYEGLLARDCPVIDQRNEHILRLLDTLGGRARRRSKVLAAFGLGQDAEAMTRLLALYPAPRQAELGAKWQALAALAHACKALNLRNGQLLAMHHEILESLLGQPDPACLYSRAAY